MYGRYAFSILIGVVVTMSLLFLMQVLIATGKQALTKPRDRAKLEFVRVKRNESVMTEDVTPEPPKPPEIPPDPPPQNFDQIDPAGPTISVAPPTVSTTGTIGISKMNVAEGDYLPIVRVAPSYPPRAQSRGIEGHVDLSFTVTSLGTVIDPVVIYSTSSLFERAAIKAVLKFKYKPRVVDGVAMDVPNVKTRITFKLEE